MKILLDEEIEMEAVMQAKDSFTSGF